MFSLRKNSKTEREINIGRNTTKWLKINTNALQNTVIHQNNIEQKQMSKTFDAIQTSKFGEIMSKKGIHVEDLKKKLGLKVLILTTRSKEEIFSRAS